MYSRCGRIFVFFLFVFPVFVFSEDQKPPEPTRGGVLIQSASKESWLEILYRPNYFRVFLYDQKNKPVPTNLIIGSVNYRVESGRAFQYPLHVFGTKEFGSHTMLSAKWTAGLLNAIEDGDEITSIEVSLTPGPYLSNMRKGDRSKISKDDFP